MRMQMFGDQAPESAETQQADSFYLEFFRHQIAPFEAAMPGTLFLIFNRRTAAVAQE
jgi:hypothetical protein